MSRLVLCLGLLAAASGCSESVGPTANTDPSNNPGVSRKNARIEAYGKQGIPTGKQAPKPAAN